MPHRGGQAQHLALHLRSAARNGPQTWRGQRSDVEGDWEYHGGTLGEYYTIHVQIY